MNTRSENGGKFSKAWKSRIIFLIFFLLLCSCESGETTFVIVPVGPSPVALNGSVQFSSTRPGLIWTVIGGEVNGTIDPFGLYTAPAALPPDPLVTILGQDGEEQVFAFVELTP